MKFAWKLVHFKRTVLVSELITNNISIRTCRWETCGSGWGQWRCGYYYIPPLSRSSHGPFATVYWTAELMSLWGRHRSFSAECHCLHPHLHLVLLWVKSHSVLIIHFVCSQLSCLLRCPTQCYLLAYPVRIVTVAYWTRGNACFSYKNNFVYFQHKVLITQKRRYFNAFLKYVPNYVWKIISVIWRPSCRTYIRSLSSKSCIARSNISCGRAAISWRMESFRFSIVRGLIVYSLDLRYPHKKSCKSIGQGNVGAKKHRRNGRSHAGGTCVYTFILSRFTKWHSQLSCKPQHRTFLRQRYETNTVTYSRQIDWQAAVTSVNIPQKYWIFIN